MSLAIDKVQSSGAVATFWVLNSIYLDAKTQMVTITMDGYVSSDTQSSGCAPLSSIILYVPFSHTDVIPNISVLTALYSKIQLDNFFNGAVYTEDGL